MRRKTDSDQRPGSTVVIFVFLMFASLALIGVSSPAPAKTVVENSVAFADWLTGFRKQAQAKGIKDSTLKAAFASVKHIPRIIELDRRQPEFTLTFWKYLNGRISEKRIRRARERLKTHKKLLDRVHAKYGVQPRFLVSFWALESNFGDYTGVFPVVGAVATLAHDLRRSKFFSEQLMALLQIIDRGDIPADVKSSWAGAMGNTQFIPTTYRDFAIDFDGDGRRNLWKSLPDVFASSANYLNRSGWQDGRTWGREVKLSKDFDLELTGLKVRKSLADWQKRGVRKIDGTDLPNVDIEGSLILPAGVRGPAFLVYQNFRSILIWNRSLLYAVAVGHLADRIAGQGALKTKAPKHEKAMSRIEIIEIQKILRTKGMYDDEPDGIVGPMTRAAIKTFQRTVRLPADGYPGMGLLERLRGATP